MKRIILLFAALLLLIVACQPPKPKTALTIHDIRVRDPFILADKSTNTYYLYAQKGNRLNRADTLRGVEVYTSTDLVNFTDPQPVFICDSAFWGGNHVWAPEVHSYNGKYYLFVTFTGFQQQSNVPGRPPLENRGSQVLVADSPLGPFKPFANKPHTPADWMALDGTLWVEDNKPYMIFCHEWIQIEDGTMELVELTDDLSAFASEPVTLFKATDAPWVMSLKDAGGQHHGYITDGPWLYETNTGKLLMIWSSFGEKGYAVGVAESESGSVRGPWVQHPEPLFKENGGHGMIFTTFDDRLLLTLHQPNSGDSIRARFFELIDIGDDLILSSNN